MNKKIKISLICIALAVAVLCVAYVTFSNRGTDTQIDTDVKDTSPSYSTPVVTETPSPSNPQPTVDPDRQVQLDDRVTVRYTEDDYVSAENTEDLYSLESYGNLVVNGFGFSSGFVLKPTKNVTPIFSGSTYGILSCSSDDFSIRVTELDPLLESIDDSVSNQFAEHGFTRYGREVYCGIPKDAKLELGVGLTDWESYIQGTTFMEDPTIAGDTQLVADYVDESAYGEVRYICFYDNRSKVFDSYAYITCDKGRILELDITGNIMSLCWSYVIEATNNSIQLIE